MTECYSCAENLDPESASALHLRDGEGTYLHTAYVCAAEYQCYDDAEEAIQRDGNRVGRTPNKAETGTRLRL